MSNNALDHLTKRFKEKMASESGKLHPIKGGEKILGQKVFCRELITAHRKNQIFAANAHGLLAFSVEILIQCLIDEDETYIFSNGSKHTLMRECDSQDIEDLAKEVSNIVFGGDDFEEIIAKEASSNAKNPDGGKITTEEKVATKN